MVVSDTSRPRQRQVIKSPFTSLEEWGAWADARCAPSRPDDLPVIAGQTGPRRHATPDELVAFFEANGLDEPER